MVSAAAFCLQHSEAVEILGIQLYSNLSETLMRQLGSTTIDPTVLTKLKEFEAKLRALRKKYISNF